MNAAAGAGKLCNTLVVASNKNLAVRSVGLATPRFSSRASRQKRKRRSQRHLQRITEQHPSRDDGQQLLQFISKNGKLMDSDKSSSVSNGNIASSASLVPTAGEQRRRRATAQAVVPWLKRDPDWREATMNALKLPKSSPSRGKGHHAGLWNDSYQSLYKDSLPSFLDSLLQQQPPANLYGALDQLANAGFDDSSFAKGYRRRIADREDAELLIGKSTANQLKTERELSTSRKNHRRTTRDIEKLEQRHSKLSAKKEAKERVEAAEREAKQQNASLWEGTVQAVSKWFFSAAAQKNQEDHQPEQQQQPRPGPLQRGLQSLEKKMKQKRKELQAQTNAISVRELKLKKMQLEHEMLSAHLNADAEDAIHAIVGKARKAICAAFANHIEKRHSDLLERYKELDAKTDLTRPYEWFLFARLDRRKVIFHGGPTNSGKTYTALQRLKEAKRGMYLGPLRLLAAEVYERLTTEGIYCNLLTGQERREVPFATHGAATIEMANLEEEYDVVVIDEIQMVADNERGFAWTRALMGIRSKEIHVCGGHEAKTIVQRIAKACGDEFEARKYERFTDLKVAPASLAHIMGKTGSYTTVQPGDCVVAFSRNDIFSIKREIESSTGYKCCVIYGSLPPQTRSEQARLFNDPKSGFDILVASDAIGMGLNLSIRRIVFNSIYKNDGSGIVRLDHSAIKQISGRAGRRNSPFPEGEVTCRDPQDMPHLRKCMATEIEPISRAGLLPTASHIELFNHTLEQYELSDDGNNDLHHILLQFNDMATVKSDYFLCRQTPMIAIARHIAELDLPIRDKYTLCMCPVVVNSKDSMEVLMRFATKLASGEVAGLSHSMIPRRPTSFDDLARLCSIFNELELFLWLQKKFPPGNMMEERAALALKEETTELIGLALAETDKLCLDHCYVNRDRRLREIWESNRDRPSQNDYPRGPNGDWNVGIEDI